MSHEVSWGSARRAWKGLTVCIGALVIGLAATIVSTHLALLLVLAAGALYVSFALASLREPLIFVTIFLVMLVILPPFFFPKLGDTPVYLSTFLIPIGLGIGIARLPEFKLPFDSVAKGLCLFLVGTGLSLPFAWLLSGSDVALQSLSRWLMLCQTALIYFLIRGGARAKETRLEQWVFRTLLVAAVISAAYGIVDFIWPIPLPHPAADQFIWLQGAVLRRAQGVFYESSNFANLCGFFLVAAAAAFLSHQERLLGVARPFLLVSIAMLSLAVLVAFSRSVWASVIATLLVFILLFGHVRLRRGAWFFLALGIPVGMLWIYSPELWNYLLSARVGYFTQIFVDPNLVSSGRFDTWARVISILEEHPQYLLFGVGYKSLPFTHLFHQEIITDNGYLSLLLETGILGLGGFLAFSGGAFKTFLVLVRRGSEHLAFWCSLLIAFWCGECIQLLVTDAYTYWRNMVVFTAVMALTLNRAEREGALAAPHKVRTAGSSPGKEGAP